MKEVLLVVFLALCYVSYGQQYTDSTFTKDINHDGTLETINFFKEYGTAAGGITYKITNGKTKEVLELSNFSSNSSTKKLIRIPTALLKKENRAFLSFLRKGLLPEKRTAPDASLQWIIDATYSSHKLKDSTYFDKVFTPNTEWVTTAYEPSSTYYIDIEGDSVQRLADRYLQEEIDTVSSKNLKGFLLYFGSTVCGKKLFVDSNRDTKGSLAPVLTNKTYDIYKTKHTILAKKGMAHKYLFITDVDINNAPQKLRWASMDRVILKDDHLILVQNLAPDPEYDVYLIHIESGNFGRLKINFDDILKGDIFVSDLTTEEKLSIKEDTIIIGRGKRSLAIPFTEIKENLADFSKSE